jgi:hypothetical protein
VFENLEALPVLPVRTQRATGKRPSRRSGSAIKEYVHLCCCLVINLTPLFFQSFPIIGIITGAVIFCAGSCVYFLCRPDARWNPASKRSLFRGELRGVDRDIPTEPKADAHH